MIQFLLNDQLQQVRALAPDTTVLEYLRNRQAMTGTKEGCASGDCGACTAVIAEPREGRLVYRAIDTCITFLGSLHGRQLITVEHLKQPHQLHPVQEAMVDCHASQCGYCTPGFVMALFALWKSHPVYDRDLIVRALAGNLCRCTGYLPIIEAAELLANLSRQDQFAAKEAETRRRLELIRRQEGGELRSANGGFFMPHDLSALGLLLRQYPHARLVGGGTDLALEKTCRARTFPALICAAAIPELQRFEQRSDELVLGAALPLSEVQEAVHDLLPSFAGMLHRFGSSQIRNQGTLGGNLANASPVGDLAPLLLALDANLILRNGDKQRAMPVARFFTGYRQTRLQPGEIIEAVRLPLPTAEQRLAGYKVSKRRDDDIATVSAAFLVELDGERIRHARCAFGGMAAIPVRAAKSEAALQGQPLSVATFVRAQQLLAQDFTPLSDVRASSAYRMQVAQGLLQRFALELMSGRPAGVEYYA